MTKGEKQRHIYINNKKIITALKEYIAWRKENDIIFNDKDWLFKTQRKQRFTPDVLQKWFRKLYDKAGIKSGDVIVTFKGKEIREYTDLSRHAGLTRPGTKVDLELIRDGEKMGFKVKLGEFDESGKGLMASKEESALGMSLQDITPDLARHFDLKRKEGVLVTDVKPDSPAEREGIQRGDVILEVNRKEVRNINGFRKALKSSSKDTVLMLIYRGEHPLYIAIKQE